MRPYTRVFFSLKTPFKQSNLLPPKCTSWQKWQPLTTSHKHLLLRVAEQPNPGFSTSPYQESMRGLKSQFKTAIKMSLYTAVSIAALVAVTWQSYHLYIEFALERTSHELSYKARNLLHGAHFREKVDPDYEIAATYLREVLRLSLEDDGLPEETPVLIQLRLRLADDELRAGNVFESVTEYTRAWKLLVSSSQTEVDQSRLLAQTAKKLGDLYFRLTDYERAEEFLAWALHAQARQDNSDDNYLRVTTMCSLASVYATQKNFKLALPLFLQSLKSIPDSDSADTVESIKWGCLKAIVQNQLSEIMFGMGRIDDALGWAQASLETSTKGPQLLRGAKGNRDCEKCAGVVSNNLGKLLELKGDLNQAMVHFKQALDYAALSEDESGYVQYNTNVDRLHSIVNRKDLTNLAEGVIADC